MRVLIIGATGGTGQALVREALARGHEVTALVRDTAKAAALLPGARLEQGDARDPVALSAALRGCEAVVSALGSRPSVGQITLLSDATRALSSVMEAQRVSRFVCITGLGAGDSAGHGGFVYDRLIKPLVLRTIYQDKDRQEAIIKDSRLDWVIVRPTVLTNKPAMHRTLATTDLDGFHGGQISRADVATFCIAQVNSDEWLRKTPVITQDMGNAA